MTVLAEGIETQAELLAVHAAGISLIQGFFFARPQLETFVTEAQIPALSQMRLAG